MLIPKIMDLPHNMKVAGRDRALLSEYIRTLQMEQRELAVILERLITEQAAAPNRHYKQLQVRAQARAYAVNAKMEHAQDIPEYKIQPLFSDNCHEAISLYTHFWRNVPMIQRLKTVDQTVAGLLEAYSDSKNSLPQIYSERRRRGVLIDTL